MLDATTTKKVATTTKKSYFIWLVGHIKYISSLPIYDLHPKFNFEVKLWFLFTCHIFILCVFIMSMQYFHKQEKRRKHLYNPKGYLPFNSCSCSLDRWGWLGCLDCGDGYWSFGLGNRKGDPYPRGPRGCWLRQQVGTWGDLFCAGHHPLCTVPSLTASSISSLIHSPGIYWAPVGAEHHSSPRIQQWTK